MDAFCGRLPAFTALATSLAGVPNDLLVVLEVRRFEVRRLDKTLSASSLLYRILCESEKAMTFRDRMRNAVYRLLYALSGPGRGIHAILLYHSIKRECAEHSYSLPLPVFEWQMAFLRDHFKCVRLCDLPEAIEAGSSNTNIACVTFDDGCLDNYEVALPVLERVGIKATFFIPTGLVGKSHRTSAGEVSVMDKEHIWELQLLEHEIGAHTINHVKLTRLPIEAAQSEMEVSKWFLEDLLGKEVVSFAYPKGDYNKAIKHKAASLGFRIAVTIREGLVPQEPDWLALPRVWINPYLSLSAFVAKVSPAVEWYEQLRGRRRWA